jgi:hypothetical protein
MTEDEARELARQRAEERPQDGWIPRHDTQSGDWSVARLPGAGNPRGRMTETMERPPPGPHDDPRTANVRNIPPYGGGI